jgi:hypothetical protein
MSISPACRHETSIRGESERRLGNPCIRGAASLGSVPIVVLVDEEREAFYGVEDPQLGEAEAGLVAVMERMLNG